MIHLAVQIAPQRNTQYAALAQQLAPHELTLSPLAGRIDNLQSISLAGQTYLSFDLDGELDTTSRQELAMLAMTGAAFVYHESIGDRAGPFLEPLELGFTPALPREIVETRRYRGKTNEMFTHFLCNVARHASGLATRPWSTLRVFDPLAGGGTTLLTALMLGASAAGVEQNDKDMASTATFLRQFLQEAAHQPPGQRGASEEDRPTLDFLHRQACCPAVPSGPRRYRRLQGAAGRFPSPSDRDRSALRHPAPGPAGATAGRRATGLDCVTAAQRRPGLFMGRHTFSA